MVADLFTIIATIIAYKSDKNVISKSYRQNTYNKQTTFVNYSTVIDIGRDD